MHIKHLYHYFDELVDLSCLLLLKTFMSCEVLRNPYNEWLLCICFISVFFYVTAHFAAFFFFFLNVSRIMHETKRESEKCGKGREMPLLSGQALLLVAWPWKSTPFSETSNGSHFGYHYYAVICMHPFVSFPFNNAHSSPAQFLKLVIKSNADLN